MTVKQDLLEDYKKAIKLKFEEEKTKDYSSFLLSPSRAKLRQLCIERFKNNSNLDDLKSFSLFFGFDFGLNIQNKLQSQTDKLRPLETFLKGETDLTDIEAINIAAILVDFIPRPFRKFSNGNFQTKIFKKGLLFKTKPIKKIKNKMAIGFLGLIGITSIGYTAKSLISPEPHCMQWQKNHYEVVNCNNEDQLGLINKNNPVPFENSQFELIKINVTHKTIFFKQGKSLFWYCKINGKPEFFNTHGVHPETNKALKPVTQYIVNKYVR